MSNIEDKKEPHYYQLINNFEDLTEILTFIEDENPEIKEIMTELKNIDTVNILESANMFKKMTKVLNFVHNYNEVISAFNICNNLDYANEALKSELKDNSKLINEKTTAKINNSENVERRNYLEENFNYLSLIKKCKEQISDIQKNIKITNNKKTIENLNDKIIDLENSIKNYQQEIQKNKNLYSKKNTMFGKLKKYFTKKDNIDIQNKLVKKELNIEKEEFSKKINVLIIENENMFKKNKKIINSDDFIESFENNNLVLEDLNKKNNLNKSELYFYSQIALDCFNKTNKNFDEAYKDHKFEDLKVANGSESLLEVVNDKIKEMVKKAEYGLLYTTIKGVEFKENEKNYFQKFSAQSNYAMKKFLTELKDPYVAASLKFWQ